VILSRFSGQCKCFSYRPDPFQLWPGCDRKSFGSLLAATCPYIPAISEFESGLSNFKPDHGQKGV